MSLIVLLLLFALVLLGAAAIGLKVASSLSGDDDAPLVIDPSAITVRPMKDDRIGTMTLLNLVKDDDALPNVSLPKVEDDFDALHWLRDTDWEMWLIWYNNQPIGTVGLHVPDLTEDPEPYADCLETDTYLLPQYRGYGIATQAWRLVEKTLPAGQRLVAECWVENTPAIRRLQKAGWRYEGDFQYDDQGGGLCARFTRNCHTPMTPVAGI